MGADNSKPKTEPTIRDTVTPLDLIPVVNKKIPKKKVATRKIVKKDKVINFMNIPLFVSNPDPVEACFKLAQDLDLYEVSI
jgi:hypothetical protein